MDMSNDTIRNISHFKKQNFKLLSYSEYKVVNMVMLTLLQWIIIMDRKTVNKVTVSKYSFLNGSLYLINWVN